MICLWNICCHVSLSLILSFLCFIVSLRVHQSFSSFGGKKETLLVLSVFHSAFLSPLYSLSSNCCYYFCVRAWGLDCPSFGFWDPVTALLFHISLLLHVDLECCQLPPQCCLFSLKGLLLSSVSISILYEKFLKFLLFLISSLSYWLFNI